MVMELVGWIEEGKVMRGGEVDWVVDGMIEWFMGVSD